MIRVLFFASVRDRLGVAETQVDPAAPTVAAENGALQVAVPPFARDVAFKLKPAR